MATRETQPVARPERLVRTAALVFVAGIFAAILAVGLRAPSVHGDSANVARGAAGALECLRHGRFTHCDGFVVHHPAGDSIVAVSPFPMLQYVPAAALQAFGVSTESTLRVFVILNLVSLIAIAALAGYTLRRLARPLWVPVVGVSLLASPLLWYARVPFGEELAAAVILAAIAAVLLDARLLIVGALVATACITKETNPPFVFALGTICVLARTNAKDPLRRQRLIAITVGTIVGVALNAGFNVFRYGTPRNIDYVRASLYVPNPNVFARLFLAQWFSPNGGLAWFWPLAPGIVLAIAAASLRRRGPTNRPRAAAPAVAVLLIAQIALLATWWAPFGWYAWGPRLVIPLLPALLVVACVVATADATRIAARFLSSRWLLLAAAAVIVIGLPQAVVLRHGLAVSQFFARSQCPRTGSVIVAPSAYYKCLEWTAWSKRPWILQLGMHGLSSTQGWLVAIAFGGATASLLYLARCAARRERQAHSKSLSPERR
ncbi:MAG: hypothetical protein QOH28_3536 [Actinomycetota bacterium]|nr:hypothetical protein [Actinomycetota bacterium]